MRSTYEFRNYGSKGTLERTEATYRFKDAGICCRESCEIPYLTILAAVIRPVEGYEVTLPKIFVHCKLEVVGLKLERFSALFAVTSEV
jgi:hypothetical protein